MYLLQIICIEVFCISITPIFTLALSIQRSKQFFEVLDSFSRFDKFILHIECPPNYKTQTFCLVYTLCVGIYHFTLLTHVKHNINILFIITLCMWTIICMSSMIYLTQYITCIRMLRNRYSLANLLFKNSKYPNIMI